MATEEVLRKTAVEASIDAYDSARNDLEDGLNNIQTSDQQVQDAIDEALTHSDVDPNFISYTIGQKPSNASTDGTIGAYFTGAGTLQKLKWDDANTEWYPIGRPLSLEVKSHQTRSENYLQSVNNYDVRLEDLSYVMIDTPVVELDQSWMSNDTDRPCVVWDRANRLWKCFYEGRANTDETFDIGMSYSTDLESWTPYSGNPVLAKSEVSFGGQYVADPSIVVTPDGKWHMYFDARDSSANAGVTTNGHAVSTDQGETWTVTPDRPILNLPSDSNEWDGYSVHAPEVIFYKGQFIMLYSGANTIYNYEGGIAYSDRADYPTYQSTYKREIRNPVIDFDIGGVLTENQARPGPLFRLGSSFYTFIDGKKSDDSRAETILGRSPDGLHWESLGTMNKNLGNWSNFYITGNAVIANGYAYLFGEGFRTTYGRTIGVLKSNEKVIE